VVEDNDTIYSFLCSQIGSEASLILIIHSQEEVLELRIPFSFFKSVTNHKTGSFQGRFLFTTIVLS
jgi:hypothetical protein